MPPPSRPRSRRSFVGSSRQWLLLILLVYVSTIIFVMNPTHQYYQQDEAPLRLGLPSFVVYNGNNKSSISSLRNKLKPSVWSLAGSNSNPDVASLVDSKLSTHEKSRALQLCGKFLFSTIQKAVKVGDMGEQTFVSTGDIDDMWTRDSAVQISLYFARLRSSPFLRLVVEGAIRRQAFNTLQDPYANAYEHKWVDPHKLQTRDVVIGRGGFVATRNYELDSGAYFFVQLYDYYVADGLYRPEVLLQEPIVFDAVMLMVETWIVEQHHETKSPYRYFELRRQGLGSTTKYTGMTWTGFRPSDDPCKYGYLIPSNIFAAGSLERILVLNERIWQSQELRDKATKLLHEIEEGIRTYGVITTKDTGEKIYAYEVDGLGNALSDFDDANVPSLLSIPLLGWSGYDKQVYKTTRERLLSSKNDYYFNGTVLQGIGSPHTARGSVWPMSLAIQALTQEGTKEQVADSYVFQLRQSLASACNDAMHESVNANKGCNVSYTRPWFEWSNALFVVLLESALGIRCDASGFEHARNSIASKHAGGNPTTLRFYNNRHQNNHTLDGFYQGVEALVPHFE